MKTLYCLLISFFIFAADQLSKWFVTEQVLRPSIIPNDPAATALAPMGFMEWLQFAPPRLPFHAIEVFPFFNLVMVWNEGVSFGLFSSDAGMGRIILIALSAIACIAFITWLFFTKSRVQSLAITMVIGGAIGNMLDRIRFGGVIDFLDFHIGGMHYPAFNIADSAIVIGVFFLLYHAFFLEDKFA